MTGAIFIRKMRGGFNAVKGFVTGRFRDIKERLSGFWKKTTANIRTTLRAKFNLLNQYRQNGMAARDVLKDPDAAPEDKRKAAGALVSSFAVYEWKIFCIFFNYLAPVLAAVFLVVTIQYFENLHYGLAYISNGKALAYIENESVYNQAEQIIRNRNFEMENAKELSPSLKVVPIDEEYLTDAEDLANIILEHSGLPVYEGYGLYIDDEFIGSTDNADNLLLLLDEYREQYREEGDTESRLQFLQKIQLTKGIYPTSSIKAIPEYRTLFNTEIEGEQYYTVEAGDAPLSIAAEFGLTYRELCNMNPGIESGIMHVGDQVVISKSVSYLNVTMTRREVYNEDVPYGTDYTYSNAYYTTYSKVVKAGIPGEQKVTALVTYENGVVVGRQVLQTEPISEPVNREVVVGTKSVIYSVGNASGTTHGFRWPAAGGYVSCGFMGYRGHTGMDIAGAGYGSNIYAAASGTVVSVKWNKTGYGYHLIINHGGGIQTLYAHCSNIYVVPGQYVNQGDVIAAMGRTGNVTGTHLHFEIRINGQYVNPAKYL